jgi:hypothetical protein
VNVERIFSNNIVYDLIIKDNLIILDSSFEDHFNYTKELLSKLIAEYSKNYNRPCVFHTMNETLSNSKNIFYKNFCWTLYKDINPPEYKQYKYNFTYLCGYPRRDKLHMLSNLFKSNLLTDSLWSCGSINKNYNLKLPDLPKIIDYDKSQKGKSSCWQNIDSRFFDNSRFSLVQETEMTTLSNRYTEKTYKCFWMKHPFILAGNYQTLKLLRQDGFQTFHPHIDESYDNIKNRDQRIASILKQVKILCNKTNREWKDFISNISSILIHNYNHATFLSNTLKDELA